MSFNKELEDRVHEIFDQAHPDDNINPLLEKLYEETHYSGVLYWMAYNYEEGLYGPYDLEKAIHYYHQGAENRCRDSMLFLAEYYMKQGSHKVYDALYYIEQAIEIYDTQHAQFILSKIYLLIAIYDKYYGMYKKGIRIMEELAGEGYEPAIRFIESEEDDEEEYSFVDDDLEEIFELIDEE